MLDKKYILLNEENVVGQMYMSKQFTQEKIYNYKFIENIKNIITEDYNINEDKILFRKINKIELNTLLNHFKIYQIALDNREKNILIINDDISICIDFDKHLREIYLEFPRKWDIAILDGQIEQSKCYLINENAMEKLLNYNDKIIYPLHVLMTKLDLNIYIVKNPICRTANIKF